MLTYRQALELIFERTDFERGIRPPYSQRVWRLERVSELLEQLGNPHRHYPAVHIAGTKGKGSTTAMIESILRAAGYHTGMYTSPHLHTFRERIRLDGEPITEEQMIAGIERLVPLLATRPEVTVFEIITALAMWIFAQHEVGWGVFEVGLGGRLDATNVLRPRIAVITSISLDHVQVLGDTVSAIAAEKAGIIKEGVPVVIAPQQPAALEVLEATAQERHAPLIRAGEDWRWRYEGSDLDGQQMTLFRSEHAQSPEYPGIRLPLLGAHQLENACIAVAAISRLQEEGIEIASSAVYEGLAKVRWPGRMEILGKNPLVIVDGAHNGDSIQKLLAAAKAYLEYRRLVVVFGVGTTHDASSLLQIVAGQADSLWVTQANHPKATPVSELLDMARAQGARAKGIDTVSEALASAVAAAKPDDLVLVTGSLFVVAEARQAWLDQQGIALPSDPPGIY